MSRDKRASRSYTHEEIAAALKETHGLITLAARSLGCTKQTVHRHINQSALVREALAEAREFTLDVAESSLFNQVLAGEGWAVCFLLKTLGKSRGYVERQEHEHSGEVGVRQIVIEDARSGHTSGAAAALEQERYTIDVSLPPGATADMG